jgi:hypothetical protein
MHTRDIPYTPWKVKKTIEEDLLTLFSILKTPKLYAKKSP